MALLSYSQIFGPTPLGDFSKQVILNTPDHEQQKLLAPRHQADYSNFDNSETKAFVFMCQPDAKKYEIELKNVDQDFDPNAYSEQELEEIEETIIRANFDALLCGSTLQLGNLEQGLDLPIDTTLVVMCP